MLTLSSMENLIVPCNLLGVGVSCRILYSFVRYFNM